MYTRRKGERVFVPEEHQIRIGKRKVRLFSVVNVIIYVVVILLILFLLMILV